SEIDSTFIVSITARNMANGCDTIINRYYYVAPEPIPGFSSNIGCAGAAVNFTDTSSIVRGTLAYSWNFGDPNSTLDTSNVKNPSYTYSVGGSYTITLRVTSNLGYSTTITKSIDVGYFPTPSFSVVNKCEGDSTSFINKTTLQGPVLAISYLWNFGDSGLSTLQNPKWMYNNIGVYNVTLKATTAFGCSNTFTSNSTVFPIPVADFTAGNACEGSSVGLTNNSTIDFGTMGANWSFGDGNNSNEFSTQHTYATANTYSVKLITYSDFGCSDTVTKQVTVSATPKATFTSVGNCSGDDIVFTNTSTFGGSFTSEWDLGTNSFVQNNATSITKMFQPGTYTVRLKAVSGLCSDIETFVLTVKESPVVGFAVPASACIGTAVQINNTTTGPGSLSYGWSFGDATTSTSMNPSKTYTSAGSYTIHLGVLAANGCADSTSANVVVNALPNAAYSYSKSTVFNSRQVTFTPGSTSFFTYDWDFGDGNGSNQLAPVYTYLSNGPFNAKLTVTDNNGCMNTTTQPVAFSVSSKAITAQTFNFDVYPNPFTSTATINYSLVKGGNLEVKVFDMYGREVAVLFNGKQNAGGYEISFIAEEFNLSAGNYMVQLTLNGETASKQIIRVK
ncbi:MAG: PKD domain-containing protein, partial [Bacteroidia bacterium]|nr:PKD domain-containing protein [Bacteroidia bacterium]